MVVGRLNETVIIGFGAIGSKHARVLESLGHDVAVVSRRSVQWPNVYTGVAQAIKSWRPHYVVIASRTSEHFDDLSALSMCGFEGAVLVEKPVFHQLMDVPANSFADIFIGYNLRFHPALIRLKAILTELNVLAVQAYVGSDVTGWRPQMDYRETNSASKAGGGVLRDLSHELDCLTWILGPWTRLTACSGCFSDLEIDSDDVFSILYETERCPIISVQLNYLDNFPSREILALTDKGRKCQLIDGTLEFDGKCERFGPVIQDTYPQHQSAIAGNRTELCDLAEGLGVIEMIIAAERAAEQKYG